MKKIVLTLLIATIATCLPAPTITMTIARQDDGRLQILTSGITGWPTHGRYCVLQATTDFVSWTSLSTNIVHYPFSGTITNIVQPTNLMTFYRIYVPNY